MTLSIMFLHALLFFAFATSLEAGNSVSPEVGNPVPQTVVDPVSLGPQPIHLEAKYLVQFGGTPGHEWTRAEETSAHGDRHDQVGRFLFSFSVMLMWI